MNEKTPQKERPKVIENALDKFWEADYFWTLMLHVDLSGKGVIEQLTDNELKRGNFPLRTAEKEFQYLLSAFLNSCFSATEHLGQDKSCREQVKHFRQEHKNIYGSGSNGGWRTKSVHFAPVNPGFRGHLIPLPNPSMDAFIDDLESELENPYEDESVIYIGDSPSIDTSRITPEGISTTSFLKNSFYFDDIEPQDKITDICIKHLLEVGKLISNCEEIIVTNGDGYLTC